MKRAIEYTIDTAKELVESLESNDGRMVGLVRKLTTMINVLDAEGEYEPDGIIDIALARGAAEGTRPYGYDAWASELWTRDELVTFAYASMAQFD